MRIPRARGNGGNNVNGVGRGEKEENKEKTSVLTRETVGMTLFLFSVILTFILVTGRYVFGEIGLAIASFFIGVFGFYAYPVFALLIYTSVALIANKRWIPIRWLVDLMLLCAAVLLIVHTSTAERFYLTAEGVQSFGAYISGCWGAAAEGIAHGTGGGVFFGLIAYPIRHFFTAAGAYVLYALLTLVALFCTLLLTPLRKRIFPSVNDEKKPKEKKEPAEKSEMPIPSKDDSVNFSGMPAPERAPVPDAEPTAATRSYATRSERPAPEAQPIGAERTAYELAYERAYGRYGYGAYGAYGAYPYAPQPEPPQEPAPAPEPEPQPSASDDIFSGAPDYRGNLFYDRDSIFNTIRRSPEPPQSPSPAATGSTPAASAAASPRENYTDAFSREAEEPRTTLPRKVTPAPQQPTRSEEINYPALSYQPPFTPSEEKRDYYRNDVPDPSERPASPEPPARGATDAEEGGRESMRRMFGGLREDRDTESSGRDGFLQGPKRDELPRSDLPEEPKRDEPTRSSFLEEPKRDEPTRSSFLEEPKRDEPTRSSFLEEPKREEPSRGSFLDAPRREEPTRSSFPEEPKRDSRDSLRDFFGERRDEPRSGFFEEPKRDEPRSGFFEEPKRDEPRSGFFEEPKRDEPRSGFFEEPKRDEPRSGFFEEPKRDEPRSSFFEEPTRETPTRDETRDVRGRSSASLFDEEEELGEEPQEDREDRGLRDLRRTAASRAERPAPAAKEEKPREKHVYKPYNPPPIELFQEYDETVQVPPEEIKCNKEIIIDTLKNFRVETQIERVTCGSTVTRYDIDIPRNASISSVTKHAVEIAMRLRAARGVNMYANNEAGAISIEVPNARRATVGLRSILNSREFRETKPTSLTFAIGKDIEGRCVCGDIVDMTHILVAGTTGSGKSVCLNSMIISLICKYSPEQLRLILVDPKHTEFTAYEGIPHLMINEIITDAPKTVAALKWAVEEMERRYVLFKDKTHEGGMPIHKLDDYNSALNEDEEKLPKIVIVVDELADLMSVAKQDIEALIQRISQKARAAGIHLVLATQRPSTDVITGVIKSNLPTRIALSVSSDIDSRVILDASGAEKLLGNGDLIFTIGGSARVRAQGAWISNKEMKAVIDYVKENNENYYDESVLDYMNRIEQSDGDDDDGEGGKASGEVGENYIRALAIVVKRGQASISLIQRTCSVGYSTAGKIIEWMEAMKYISPFDGKAKARDVLLTQQEFDNLYGGYD